MSKQIRIVGFIGGLRIYYPTMNVLGKIGYSTPQQGILDLQILPISMSSNLYTDIKSGKVEIIIREIETNEHE